MLAVEAVFQVDLGFPNEVIEPTRSQSHTATVSMDSMGKQASMSKDLVRRGWERRVEGQGG